MRFLGLAFVAVFAAASSPASAYNSEDAASGAAFRDKASNLVKIIAHPCADLQALGDVPARYEALKARLAGSSSAVDIAIVEADHDYAMARLDMLCPEPGASEPPAYSPTLSPDLTQRMAANLLGEMTRLAGLADKALTDKEMN